MIGFLSGNVFSIDNDKAVILTATGIGYTVSLVTASAGLAEGIVVEAFIYTHVRENEISLYGFASRLDQKIFELLIGVSGVGPKAAQALLSNHGTASIINAVLANDAKSIQTTGVGKKTAEKICIELKDKFEKAGFVIDGAVSNASENNSELYSEIEVAFLSLGLTKSEIRQLYDDITHDDANLTTSEEFIREGLRRI